MATIHPLFAGVLEQHFPGLQQPAPVEAEEEDAVICVCGSTRTFLRDDCDPSTGYYDRVECCTGCGRRVD
jgi:hypothetical protein